MSDDETLYEAIQRRAREMTTRGSNPTQRKRNKRQRGVTMTDTNRAVPLAEAARQSLPANGQVPKRPEQPAEPDRPKHRRLVPDLLDFWLDQEKTNGEGE